MHQLCTYSELYDVNVMDSKESKRTRSTLIVISQQWHSYSLVMYKCNDEDIVVAAVDCIYVYCWQQQKEEEKNTERKIETY